MCRNLRHILMATVVSAFALPAFAMDFDAAWEVYQSRDYDTAREAFRELSEDGHVEATYWLGSIYFWGRGIEQDYEEAYRVWRPIAEDGHSLAQWRMGHLYRHGRGVERDRAEAAKWYQRAADQGNWQAMTDLGDMYQAGLGVEKDEDRAYALYSEAAKVDKRVAPYQLGLMYWREGVGPHDDVERALHWFRISAEANYGPSMRMLGHAYWKGRGVEQDRMEALRMLVLAEENGAGGQARTILEILGEMTEAERDRAEELYETWIAEEED